MIPRMNKKYRIDPLLQGIFLLPAFYFHILQLKGPVSQDYMPSDLAHLHTVIMPHTWVLVRINKRQMKSF
jgi:hypothetical protein